MSVLEVFRSLPTVREVVSDESQPPAARVYDRDTITLGWEDRLKARGRRTSDRGAEFGTALPRGTILRGGDRLVVDALRLVVTVVELAEPVLVVTPATAYDWGLIGYHIGNSHQPLMLTEHEIICVDGPPMQLVLEQHGIPFVRTTRPFTPVGLIADHRH